MTSARGVVLDAGLFMALERRNRVAVHLTRRLSHAQTPLVTSAGVVAQVWRGGAGEQVPISYTTRGQNLRQEPLGGMGKPEGRPAPGNRKACPCEVYLLRRTQVVDLTHSVARTLGRMLAPTGTSDPIDAHVVLLARERGWPVLSSDPDDLHAIDPSLVIERI